MYFRDVEISALDVFSKYATSPIRPAPPATISLITNSLDIMTLLGQSTHPVKSEDGVMIIADKERDADQRAVWKYVADLMTSRHDLLNVSKLCSVQRMCVRQYAMR